MIMNKKNSCIIFSANETVIYLKTSISMISPKYLLLDSLYLKHERQEEKTMNSQKKRIQQLTLAAFFVAIEVIMSVTPIGYIPVGAL